MLFVKFLFRIAYNDTRFTAAFCKHGYVLVYKTRRFTATRRADDQSVQLTRCNDFNASALFLRADDDSVRFRFRKLIIVNLKFFEFFKPLHRQPLGIFQVVFVHCDILRVHPIHHQITYQYQPVRHADG